MRLLFIGALLCLLTALGYRLAFDTPEVVISNMDKADLDHRHYWHDTHNGLSVLYINNPSSQQAAVSLISHFGSGHSPASAKKLVEQLQQQIFIPYNKQTFADFITTKAGEFDLAISSGQMLANFQVPAEQLNSSLRQFFSLYTQPDFPQDSGINSDLIRDFYQTHYHSHNHTIIISSPFSAQKMQSMLKPLAQTMNNRQQVLPVNQQLIPIQSSDKVFFEHNEQQEILRLSFLAEKTTPSHHDYLMFLGYLLESPIKDGLLEQLRNQGLALEIQTKQQPINQSQYRFDINLTLPKDTKVNIEKTLTLVFSALQSLKQKDRFIQHYNSYYQSKIVAFNQQQHQSSAEYVQQLAHKRYFFNIEQLATQALLTSAFNDEDYQRLINMLSIDHLTVTLFSTQHHLGKKTLSNRLLTQLRNIEQPIELLHLNPLLLNDNNQQTASAIPSDLYEEQPQLIEQQQENKLWFLQDNHFLSSQVAIIQKIPVSFPISDENNLLASLYAVYITLQLEDINWAAKASGYSNNFIYSRQADERYFQLSVSGPTQHSQTIQQLWLNQLTEFKSSAVLLNRAKQLLIANLQQDNQQNKQPLNNLTSKRLQLKNQRQRLLLQSFNLEQKVEFISEISNNHLADFVQSLSFNNSISMLIEGDIQASKARTVFDGSIKILSALQQTENAQTISQPTLRPIDLSTEHFAQFIPELNSDKSAIHSHIQLPAADYQASALLKLLELLFANKLQEQLTIISPTDHIHVHTELSNEIASLNIDWQSAVTDPAVMYLRLEKVLSQVQTWLTLPNNKEYAELKQILSLYYQQPASSLKQQAHWHWQNITNNNIHFNDRKRLAFAIEALSKDSIQRIIDTQIAAINARKLTLFSSSKKHQADFNKNKRLIKSLNVINNAEELAALLQD